MYYHFRDLYIRETLIPVDKDIFYENWLNTAYFTQYSQKQGLCNQFGDIKMNKNRRVINKIFL